MKYKSIYNCIEAPCCYQDPKPILEYVWEPTLLIANNKPYWECPMCKARYSQELIEKISKNGYNSRLQKA